MYFGVEKQRKLNGQEVKDTAYAINNVYVNGVRVAAVTADGTARYYLTDQVDSVKVVVDDNGAAVTTFEYTPYGEEWLTEGDTDHNPKYNSQELDRETNFYYYNARHYDPALSRFVTADNVIPDEFLTQSWNRYTYVRNNPIRYKDPTGHNEWDIVTGDSGISEEEQAQIDSEIQSKGAGLIKGATVNVLQSTANLARSTLDYATSDGYRHSVNRQIKKRCERELSELRSNPGQYAKTSWKNFNKSLEDPETAGQFFSGSAIGGAGTVSKLGRVSKRTGAVRQVGSGVARGGEIKFPKKSKLNNYKTDIKVFFEKIEETGKKSGVERGEAIKRLLGDELLKKGYSPAEVVDIMKQTKIGGGGLNYKSPFPIKNE